jgi:MoaA/NifB/PqqE/SkfB family radical SAM enzyme
MIVSDYDFTKIPWNDIKSVGTFKMLESDLFTVSWLLGRFCNYRCSYCWPYARSNTKDHRPTELCLKTIDEIKKQARNNGFNSFHFSLSGGEPTFHPGYLDILEYLADDIENTNYTSVHMTSNCSRPMKWFEKYVNYANKFTRSSITASYHRESVNDDEKIKEYANKLDFCQKNGVRVTINSVMVPEKFDEIYNELLYFVERGINVTLKPQSDPTASRVVDGYTQKQMEILHNGMPQITNMEVKSNKIKNIRQEFEIVMKDSNNNEWYLDQAERFNAFNFNNFKGWYCRAGYQSIVIREPDGSIKRSYSCSDVPIGNIETGFKLFDKPVKCITNACVSSADSKIPKEK